MSTVIRDLAAKLSLETKDFNKGIKDAQREAKAFEDKLKPTTKLLGDMGKAASIAGIAIVGAFALAIKSAADYGDEMNDAAKRTGVTTENLSKLRLAAETSGSSFQGLSNGLKFLGKNMEEATSGSKQQLAAFRAAGISSKDLADANGDVNVIFHKLADSFANAEDGAGKTALSMELLGRSGIELIPTLNESSAGLTKWGIEAQKSGRVISAEAAAAADEFNDKLRILEVSVLGLTNSIGSSLIPKMTAWIMEGTKVIQQVRDWTVANKELTTALGATGLILAGAGGIMLTMAALPAALSKATVAWAALTAAVSAATLGFAAALSAVIYFRNEIAMRLIWVFGAAVEAMEKFTGAAAILAGTVGLDGLAVKLHVASFNTGTFRRELEDTVTMMMRESKAAEEAAAMVKAQGDAHDATAESVKKNKLALEGLTEASKLMLDAQKLAEREAQKTGDAAEAAVKEESDNLLGYQTRVLQDMLDDRIKAYGTIIDIIKKSNAVLAGGLEEEAADFLKYQTRVYQKNLDEQIKLKEDQEAAIRKMNEENAAYLNKRYNDTFNSIQNTASKVFTNMIQDGKIKFSSMADALKGIFNTLWTELLSKFTAKLLTPLVSSLSNALGGLLNKIPGMGGVFGGLAQAGAGAGTAAATTAAGGAAATAGVVGGTGTAGASIAALATNPITIAVAGAIAAGLLINKFAGQGRKTANEFVQGVENPFGSSLAAISNGIQASQAAGTLTASQLKSAREAMAKLVGEFETAAAAFATQGSNEAKVVAQSRANFANIFGPGFSKLFEDLKSASPSVIAGIPQTGVAKSASQIFAEAVDKFVGSLEKIIAPVAAEARPQIQFMPEVNIELNVNLGGGADINAETVRSVIAPELTRMLDANTRGLLADWSADIQRALNSGLVPVTS